MNSLSFLEIQMWVDLANSHEADKCWVCDCYLTHAKNCPNARKNPSRFLLQRAN